MSETTTSNDTLVACTEGKSPFTKMIALDYYDGPTFGLLWDHRRSAAYKFDMLDWDDHHRVRVFSLAELPEGAFDRVAEACATTGPPAWPIWVPNWQFESDASRDAANRVVDAVLEQASRPHAVVAAEDLLDTILRARRTADQDLAAGQDWFALLGLER